jgi:hypothetical protein
MADMDRNGKIGVAIVCLIGAASAFLGLMALFLAWRNMASLSAQSMLWAPLLLGTVFSAIGFGLMYLALTGSKRMARQKHAQSIHPGEPWMWRADWAQGRANSAIRGSLASVWIAAVLWNLCVFPCFRAMSPTEFQRNPATAFLVLLFPAAGLFLLFRAVRTTLVVLEFGTTYFAMASVPGDRRQVERVHSCAVPPFSRPRTPPAALLRSPDTDRQRQLPEHPGNDSVVR